MWTIVSLSLRDGPCVVVPDDNLAAAGVLYVAQDYRLDDDSEREER